MTAALPRTACAACSPALPLVDDCICGEEDDSRKREHRGCQQQQCVVLRWNSRLSRCAGWRWRTGHPVPYRPQLTMRVSSSARVLQDVTAFGDPPAPKPLCCRKRGVKFCNNMSISSVQLMSGTRTGVHPVRQIFCYLLQIAAAGPSRDDFTNSDTRSTCEICMTTLTDKQQDLRDSHIEFPASAARR